MSHGGDRRIERCGRAHGIARRGLILAFIMRFKQICNHPDQWLASGRYAPEESGKFHRLRELVEEIARENNLHFRMALIHSEQGKEYLSKKLADGKIQPLWPLPPLTQEAIDRSSTVVGMAGVEPYIAALGVAKEFARTGKHLRWELEGQVLKHFSRQDHWELTAALVVRWVTFPWDHYLDTTFAAGDGLSYATDIPRIEGEKHNTTTRLLNYLLFEFTFSIPEHPEWALVTRIHHRSGVFGMFDGVRGASNVLGAGLRYSF
jgi:hypothetical protein